MEETMATCNAFCISDSLTLKDAFEEEINDGPATAKSATVVSRPTSAKSPRTPGVTEVGLEMRNR